LKTSVDTPSEVLGATNSKTKCITTVWKIKIAYTFQICKISEFGPLFGYKMAK
jgi:hypothetical protein